MKNRNADFYIGIVLVSVVLLMAVIGLFYTPYDPYAMDANMKNAAPCLSHIFGCDNFGRDVLSRVMKGAGTTFLIGGCVVTFGAAIGIVLGAVTGYYGGIIDEIFMRINDVIAAFPSVLLAIVFVAVVGTGKFNVILALGVAFIPSFARVVRGEFKVQRELDYVKNAKLFGASDFRIIFFHILPNAKNVIWSALLVGLNNAVLAEAGMSYLGLGVQPPEPSLGRMLSEAQGYLMTAPWYAFAPGCVIVMIVLGINLLGRKKVD